jgi:methionyl-tRNA formyltransferase
LKIWAADVEPKPPAVGIAGTVTVAKKSGIAVATGEGVLVIRELQLEGGRRLKAAEFLSGHRMTVGVLLGRGN